MDILNTMRHGSVLVPPLLHRLILGATIIALVAAPVRAQQLIGLEFFDGEIYSIDLHSGEATQIASTSVNKSVWIWHSLARNSVNQLFASYDYLNSGPSEIYEIDPLTGQCTFITTISLVAVVGLAFGPGDVLYAINDPTAGSSGSTFDLHTIDLATGATTFIGNTGFTNLGSLTYGEGTLWSYGGSGVGLLKIDPVTGVGTDVNPAFRGPLDFMESHCFSDDGVMYQVDAGFWIQDTLTGVPTFVGPLNFPGILGGIEYLPGPTSPFTLGTLGKTDGLMGLQVWGATPLATVAVLMAQGAGGPSSIPAGKPCAGTLLNLNASRSLLVLLRTNAAGRASYGPVFVPAIAARSTHLQALDLASCTTSNPAQIIY